MNLPHPVLQPAKCWIDRYTTDIKTYHKTLAVDKEGKRLTQTTIDQLNDIIDTITTQQTTIYSSSFSTNDNTEN